MGNCTSSKVSAAGNDVDASAPATKATVVAEASEDTPPETPEVINQTTAAATAPVPTAAPPLPARPVAAGATPEVAGGPATSTPPPALAGEAGATSPPPPEKVEEQTDAASPDPPPDVAAADSPEQEGEVEGESPPAPEDEPENPQEAATSSSEPPAGEGEAQQEEQPKQLSFDEWIEEKCQSTKYIPRKGSDELKWDAIYPPQKDLEKPVTQCCAWMGALSANVLMTADLGGGTLFDWWNTHIGQGEAETDLTPDQLFERAVAGLKATIVPELREALEAGADSAVTENLHLKIMLKNCFDAPAPPEGATGGEDGKMLGVIMYSYATGESYPEPHTWITGGYMYGFGPSHITASLVSKDHKYVVGDYCTRPELERALGRSVEDSEVHVRVEEVEELGEGEEEEGGQEKQQEQKQGEQHEEEPKEEPEEEPEDQPKQISFDEWIKQQCHSMKYLPLKGSEELEWDKVYSRQKDREKPATQCCVWISGLSPKVLMTADLGGGTLFDWWNTHIGQGEAETDLTPDQLFERAVAGLKATIVPELREALEAGADSAVTESLHLKIMLKNCFDAPAPPEGTTGCGEDGKCTFPRCRESYPEPHTWVTGGYMYAFGPSDLTARLMSKDRKYVVGGYCTRPELEKALGRSVEDDEVEVHVGEEEEEDL
eukprot:g14294.t1